VSKRPIGATWGPRSCGSVSFTRADQYLPAPAFIIRLEGRLGAAEASSYLRPTGAQQGACGQHPQRSKSSECKIQQEKGVPRKAPACEWWICEEHPRRNERPARSEMQMYCFAQRSELLTRQRETRQHA
jgi:hypothetical protein